MVWVAYFDALPAARLRSALASSGSSPSLWSLGSGQYDDMEGAALRMLSDDDLDA